MANPVMNQGQAPPSIPPPLAGGVSGGGWTTTFPYPRNSPPPENIDNPTVGSPPTDPDYKAYELENYNDYIRSPGYVVGSDDGSDDDAVATRGAGVVTMPMPKQLFQQLQQSLVMGPPQNPTLAQLAEVRARRFVRAGKVPRIAGWDWEPFMAALFEADTKVPLDDNEDAINFNEAEDGADNSDDSNTGDSDSDSSDALSNMSESRYTPMTGMTNQPTPIPSTLEPDQRPPKGDASSAHRPPITSHQPPPKQPGDGSWDFVVYVPEWTDPLWDPAWERLYGTDKKKQRLQRDALQNLRPALRPEDAVRNPTPYARRWGIAAERNDGRSRTSPTFSRTRDFGAAVDDNIINKVMDDTVRARCVAETQRLIAQGQTAYRGPGIAPEVMDQYRQHVGIPSQEDIRTGAVKAGMPFERYIETLHPRVRDLYSGLIDDVLEDEDYQRILFFDMTSDEMYRNNVFTMSDNEKYNLSPMKLHP